MEECEYSNRKQGGGGRSEKIGNQRCDRKKMFCQSSWLKISAVMDFSVLVEAMGIEIGLLLFN